MMKVYLRFIFLVFMMGFVFIKPSVAINLYQEHGKNKNVKPKHHVFYVAVNGSSAVGDPLAGNIDNPWNLQTACNQPSPMKAGDIILMKQGTYRGHFTCHLTGTKYEPMILQATAWNKVVIASPDNLDSFSVKGSWADYKVKITGTNYKHFPKKQHNEFQYVTLKNATKDIIPAVNKVSNISTTSSKAVAVNGAVKPKALSAPPNGPENVIAYATLPTNIDVKWSDSSSSANAATSFLIDRSVDGVNFTNIATTANVTNRYYKDTTVSANQGYYYRVEAQNANGISGDASDPFWAMTAGYVLSASQVQTNTSTSNATNTNSLKVKINASGTYVILGTYDDAVSFGNSKTLSAPTGSSTNPYFIVEYNSGGTAQWVASVDETVYSINDIAIDKNGDVAITGTTTDPAGSGNTTMFVTSYTSAGALAWTNIFALSTASAHTDTGFSGNAVTFDNSSTPVVLVTGEDDYTDSKSNSFTAAIVYAVTSASASSQIASFTGTVISTAANSVEAIGKGIAVDSTKGTATFNSIVVTGGVIVTGQSSYDDSANSIYRLDAFVNKYGNGAGNFTPVLIQGSDPDNPSAVGYSLAIDPSTANKDGILLLADLDTSSAVPVIYKFSSTGTTATGFPVILPASDIINDFHLSFLGVDVGGNIWIVNPLTDPSTPDADIRKYSPSGTMLWSKFQSYASNSQNSLDNFPLPGAMTSGALTPGGNMLVVGDMDAVSQSVYQIDELTISPNGNTDIFAATYSDAGTFSDDIIPPTGSVSSVSCSTTWCNSTITVKLTATDNSGGSGIGASIPGSMMRYSVDSQNTWISPENYATTDSIAFPTGTSGSMNIYYQFMDARYNWSVSYYKSVAHAVDAVPPTGTISINSQASLTHSPSVTLTLSATDNTGGSGMGSGALMKFTGCTNLTGSVSYATTATCSLPAGDGSKTVSVQFADVAGNWSSYYSSSINLQTITGTITINSSAVTTNSPSVTLNLSATDLAGSSLSKMRFRNENTQTWSAWQAYSTTAAWTLSSKDGVKTVSAEFEDAAGDISSIYTASINFQTISGTIANSTGATSSSSSVTLDLTETDITAPTSAVSMQFKNENTSTWSSWEVFSATKAWTLSSGYGTKTVSVQFKDAAGDQSIAYSVNIAFGAAAGSACVSNTDCLSGVCSGVDDHNYPTPVCLAIGNNYAGNSCSLGSDCQSGICNYWAGPACSNGYVGDMCYDGTWCSNGLICVFRRCSDRSSGSICQFASDCQSGNCVNNKCQ